MGLRMIPLNQADLHICFDSKFKYLYPTNHSNLSHGSCLHEPKKIHSYGQISDIMYTPLNDKKGIFEITYNYTLIIRANALVNPNGKDVTIKNTIHTGITGTIKNGTFVSSNYKPIVNATQTK